MLGTLCLGYGRRAYAQCAPSGPAGTYSCSGSATATQSLSPSPSSAALVVTTTPGFGITTTAGDAFDLSTTASGTGLSFTDANGSMIAGSGYGINAANLGGGDLTITTTGSVSGGVLQTVTASGIQAKNYGAGLTISSAGVIGTNYGITALNEGVGALSITATGAVAGNYNSGIAAKNYGTSLTISAGAVVGGNYGVASGAKGDGVYALNRGSGALSITTSGPVAGAGSGIEARNYGTSLTISAAGAVSGGKFGVYAVNQGSGALSITTTGQVSGGARGIVARNYGTSLSISAAGASGAVVGIGGLQLRQRRAHDHRDRNGERGHALRIDRQRLPVRAGCDDSGPERVGREVRGASAWTTGPASCRSRPPGPSRGPAERAFSPIAPTGAGSRSRPTDRSPARRTASTRNSGLTARRRRRSAPCRSPRPEP